LHCYKKQKQLNKFQFVEQLAYGREQAKRDDEGIVPYKPYFDPEDNPGR